MQHYRQFKCIEYISTWVSKLISYSHKHTYIYAYIYTYNNYIEGVLGRVGERATTTRRFSGVYTITKCFVSARESASGQTGTQTHTHTHTESKERAPTLTYTALSVHISMCEKRARESAGCCCVCEINSRDFWRAAQIMKNAIGYKTGIYIRTYIYI